MERRSRPRRRVVVTSLAGFGLLVAASLSGCGTQQAADHGAAPTTPAEDGIVAGDAPSAEQPVTTAGNVTGVAPGPRAAATASPVNGAPAAFGVWAVDEVVSTVDGRCPLGSVPMPPKKLGGGPTICFRRTTEGERLGPETIASVAALSRGRGAARSWYVAVTLTPDGLDRLNRLATAVRLGKGQLAVEFDGRVLTAPVLQGEPYRDATVDITGDVEESTARTIAAALTPA